MSKLRKDVEALVLGKKRVKDYDPEDENEANEDNSAENTEDEEVPFGDREHYQAVGKSKLRKSESAPLDPKYRGVAISRKALASDSDENDPFAVGEDESEVEDGDPFAVDGDDLEDQRSDVSITNTETREGEEDDIGLEDGDEEDPNDDTDDDMDILEDLDNDEDDMSDDSDSQSDTNDPGASGARGDLRALLSNDTKALAQGLSQAAVADAAKGRAVKRQYQNFDRILDARMKLQKGLTASDGLPTQDGAADFTLDAREALRVAQESARQVFNSISSFRDSITNASSLNTASRKRKRPVYMGSVEELGSAWQSLHLLEIETTPARRAIIDKWSSREKAFDSTLATTRPKQRLQATSSQQDQLTAVLDVYVANEQEKQFRGLDEEEPDDSNHQALRLDDSMFYQSLLRDLITSRSATSSIANNLSGALLPYKLHPSGNRENKKTIDTKASKGRKIRYTVHEKLQNFMAAEGDTGRDTAMWTERGKNQFFGSLFGQDRALVEDLDTNKENDEAEVEALRLFQG